MGLSNLTSSIRSKAGLCITGLKNVEATSGIFTNITPNSISNGGILSFFDTNRLKQLSINRTLLSFSLSHTNISAIRWLKYNGAIDSKVSGYKFIRNATIVGITVQAQTLGTGIFEVTERTNTGTIKLATMALINESDKIEDNLDIDINKNSIIEVKLVSGKFSYPTFSIEFAWKFNST